MYLILNYSYMNHQFYNKNYEIPLYLRVDSGFDKPGLYRKSEEHGILYTIRLKANAKLYKLAKPLGDKLAQQCKINIYKYQSIFRKNLMDKP